MVYLGAYVFSKLVTILHIIICIYLQNMRWSRMHSSQTPMIKVPGSIIGGF